MVVLVHRAVAQCGRPEGHLELRPGCRVVLALQGHRGAHERDLRHDALPSGRERNAARCLISRGNRANLKYASSGRSKSDSQAKNSRARRNACAADRWSLRKGRLSGTMDWTSSDRSSGSATKLWRTLKRPGSSNRRGRNGASSRKLSIVSRVGDRSTTSQQRRTRPDPEKKLRLATFAFGRAAIA